MSEFIFAVALVLLLTVAAGLVRVVRGPTPADRMLGVQLLGTNGIAMSLLLRESGVTGADDVGLVLAVFSVLAMTSFVRRLWSGGRGRP